MEKVKGKVQLTVYVPKELSEELEEVIAAYRLRRKEKLTKSEVAARALRKELGHLKRQLNR